MEFGKGVLNALPADYSQSEMEDAMLTIITVWNAIVLDTWHNTDKNEKERIIIEKQQNENI